MKLDDTLINDMRQARRDGLNVQDSCAICGISKRTHYNWVNQAKDAEKKSERQIGTNFV